MEELKAESKYAGHRVQIVDEQEQAELAAQHDFLCSTYYINGKRFMKELLQGNC